MIIFIIFAFSGIACIEFQAMMFCCNLSFTIVCKVIVLEVDGLFCRLFLQCYLCALFSSCNLVTDPDVCRAFSYQLSYLPVSLLYLAIYIVKAD